MPQSFKQGSCVATKRKVEHCPTHASLCGDDRKRASPSHSHGLVSALAIMSDSTRQLHPDVESILYDEGVIHSKCVELGAAIAKEYKDLRPLLMVTVTGAYMFASDLAKCITPVPNGMQIDFIRASSYGSGTVSSGDVKIQDCSRISVAGRHVIVLEDIVDTGGTLDKLIKRMTENGALSVKVAALLNKEARRKVDVPVHFEGFKCQDSFVIGYGMDYDEDYRTLPYVGVLKPHVYSDK